MTAVDDRVDESPETALIEHEAFSTDPNYVLGRTDIAGVDVTVLDNDVASVEVSALNLARHMCIQ